VYPSENKALMIRMLKKCSGIEKEVPDLSGYLSVQENGKEVRFLINVKPPYPYIDGRMVIIKMIEIKHII